MFAEPYISKPLMRLMREILSTRPKDIPSASILLNTFQEYCAGQNYISSQPETDLLSLISQAFRLQNFGVDDPISWLKFMKYVRRKQNGGGREKLVIGGNENYFPQIAFRNALLDAIATSGLSVTLSDQSDERKLRFSGTKSIEIGNRTVEVDILMHGFKYPNPMFDVALNFNEDGRTDASMHLSELFLRCPWKVSEIKLLELQNSLNEVMAISSRVLEACGKPS